MSDKFNPAPVDKHAANPKEAAHGDRESGGLVRALNTPVAHKFGIADGDCAAFIKAIAGLGSSLGMTTTAEGVETDEQLERVQADGCTEVQGYLFSHPRPANEIARYLATDTSRMGRVA
jgi:EAL domain-containing protein (putative c-di-GMP-specific phosphodiesterase class I)